MDTTNSDRPVHMASFNARDRGAPGFRRAVLSVDRMEGSAETMWAMHGSLALAARMVAQLPGDRRGLVAVDGVDGAGKTTFADALVPLLDRPVVRASVDDFHHPRARRYRLGRESPEGFYRDSFDLAALTGLLLEPFARGQPFCPRVFDHASDTAIEPRFEQAPADALLVLDGLFVHRAELRDRWDLSILLDVPPEVAADRLLKRDGRPTRRRYIEGQQLYFLDAHPPQHASLTLPW